MDDRGPAMELDHGRMVHILSPSPDEMQIKYLYPGCARICRFGGRVNAPGNEIYSVLQHCCFVLWLVRKLHPNDYRAQLWALVHDLIECITGDMISPMKQAMEMIAPGAFKGVEAGLEAAMIAGMDVGFSESDFHRVKQADMLAVVTEKEWFTDHILPWPDLPDPLTRNEVPARFQAWWTPRNALAEWTYEYTLLKAKGNTI